MNATESDPAVQHLCDSWAQIIDDWAQARSGPPLATPLVLDLGPKNRL